MTLWVLKSTYNLTDLFHMTKIVIGINFNSCNNSTHEAYYKHKLKPLRVVIAKYNISPMDKDSIISIYKYS